MAFSTASVALSARPLPTTRRSSGRGYGALGCKSARRVGAWRSIVPRHPTSRCSSLGNGGCRQNGNEEAEDYRRHSHRGGVEKGNVLPADGLKEIGSMYGEGFSQLGMDGKVRELDVHTLNEKLRVLGAERMRHAMYPDAAYGMVFSWEGGLANTRAVQLRAWKLLAEEEGLWFPPIERQALFDVLPERAITEILNWTRDWGLARRYSMKLAHLYREELLRTPAEDLLVPGARQWLQALRKAKVPCGVVSCMERPMLKSLLDRTGLWRLFDVQVTAEDGMETMSEMLLGAAIKLGRPPNRCVSFVGTISGLTASHNCTMKAVGVLGNYRGFELKTAEVTISSMEELSVYNIRRMFANVGSEFMDLSLQVVGDGENPPGRRRLTNGLVD